MIQFRRFASLAGVALWAGCTENSDKAAWVSPYPIELGVPFHGILVPTPMEHQPPSGLLPLEELRVDALAEALLFSVGGHPGYDWGMPKGTPLVAVYDGWLLVSENEPMMCHGWRIPDRGHALLLTDSGYWVSYAHLDERLPPGHHYVHRGDWIGTVGESGCARFPHLHLNVLKVDQDTKALVDPFDPSSGIVWSAESTPAFVSRPNSRNWEFQCGPTESRHTFGMCCGSRNPRERCDSNEQMYERFARAGARRLYP